MEKQFSIGDKVLVLRDPREVEGYDARMNCLTSDSESYGKQGTVIEVDYSYQAQFPDVLVDLGGDRNIYLDINYVRLIGKPAKPLTPQCLELLEHMTKGHSVTQRSALIDFSIAALPRRISDLKNAVTRSLRRSNATQRRAATMPDTPSSPPRRR